MEGLCQSMSSSVKGSSFMSFDDETGVTNVFPLCVVIVEDNHC